MEKNPSKIYQKYKNRMDDELFNIYKKRKKARRITFAIWVIAMIIFLLVVNFTKPIKNEDRYHEVSEYPIDSLVEELSAKGFVLIYDDSNQSQMQMNILGEVGMLGINKIYCGAKAIQKINGTYRQVNATNPICFQIAGFPAWKLPDGEYFLGFLSIAKLSFLLDYCDSYGCMMDE